MRRDAQGVTARKGHLRASGYCPEVERPREPASVLVPEHARPRVRRSHGDVTLPKPARVFALSDLKMLPEVPGKEPRRGQTVHMSVRHGRRDLHTHACVVSDAEGVGGAQGLWPCLGRSRSPWRIALAADTRSLRSRRRRSKTDLQAIWPLIERLGSGECWNVGTGMR
jgi:hypothetical protein